MHTQSAALQVTEEETEAQRLGEACTGSHRVRSMCQDEGPARWLGLLLGVCLSVCVCVCVSECVCGPAHMCGGQAICINNEKLESFRFRTDLLVDPSHLDLFHFLV